MSSERYEKVGALWPKFDKAKGREYHAGHIVLPDGRKIGILVHPNDYREGNERRPDLLIYSIPDDGEDAADGQAQFPF